MTDFRQLKVWQKEHELTLDIYRATSTYSKSELYELVSQMRRCAVSIGSNIAEGRGRAGDPDFQRFLGMSIGSAAEIEYQLLLSRDLGFLSEDKYNPLRSKVAELGRMLVSLRDKVRTAFAGR